jgi:hypothetical protein
VTKVEQDQNDGLAEHLLWNDESARRNHPASDVEPMQDDAARIAAPQVPADALVDVTDGRNSITLGATRRIRLLGYHLHPISPAPWDQNVVHQARKPEGKRVHRKL